MIRRKLGLWLLSIESVREDEKGRRKLGLWLLSQGARLAFVTDADKEELKDAINHDSIVWDAAGAGGHIRSELKPMNEYDTQSVVNVLKHGGSVMNSHPPTKKVSYYSEEWAQ